MSLTKPLYLPIMRIEKLLNTGPKGTVAKERLKQSQAGKPPRDQGLRGFFCVCVEPGGRSTDFIPRIEENALSHSRSVVRRLVACVRVLSGFIHLRGFAAKTAEKNAVSR